MQDTLARSHKVITLLSEPYLHSAFGTAEWAVVFLTDPTGRDRRLVGVRVGDWQPPGLLAAVVHIDLVDLDEPRASAQLLAGLERRRPKPGAKPRFPRSDGVGAPRAFPGRLPVIWNVPARNPNFAGRDRQLDELRSALGGGAPTVAVLAVAGLGGVGKTQLSIEHAWRRAADYELVWWVPAEVPATIAASPTDLAAELGMPTDDPEAAERLLHAEMGRRARWLVVLTTPRTPHPSPPISHPGAGVGC